MGIRSRFLMFKLFFTVLLLFIAAGCSGLSGIKDNSGFTVLSPKNGIVLQNNMPSMSWPAVPCKGYVVLIDGIRMDSLPAGRTNYISFPLSFGRHTWQVIAAGNGKRLESDIAEFSVEDAPLGKIPEGSLLLRNNWKVLSSLQVNESGSELTAGEINTEKWNPTSIPATVLTSLVRNGVYPNPYVGLNNMLIPDCNDKINEQYGLLKYSHIKGKNPWKNPYWYRTEFETPGEFAKKNVWLNFGEINYRAAVWLNGRLLADTAAMVGMERQFRFLVSPYLKKEGTNYLAVLIYPPDHPGEPAPEPIEPLADPGRNLGQDGIITKDYTKWDVLGWDWQPAIRDRDMGITEDVYLSASEEIEIRDLYVTSNLNLPDTSYADITVSADVINNSGMEKEGVIKGVISDKENEVMEFEYPFRAGPFEKKTIILDKSSIPQLHLMNPKLWWPFGYGAPELYSVKLNLKAASGEHASEQSGFGIRKVETYIGSRERVYKINGREIYCKGGNWVLDMMLNWTAKRYEEEILLTRQAGINLLRIWGPTGAPPESFYDAADKYGVLLWQDFLNDFWGSEKNDPNLRPDERLFEKATTQIVKKYRNHPSLVIWCGGNEGPNPREEMIMTKILPAYDGRDSRHYLKISNGDGLHGGGPYHTLNPEEYYTNNKINGFSSEIGPSGMPVYASMQQFLPDLGKVWKDGRFPISGNWAYHDANDRPEDSRKFSFYDMIIRNRYGAPDSLNDFGVIDYMKKSQLVNYEVYRASIEALNKQIWAGTSGFGLWKTNSSWPSLVWQIYDWYKQAHAGFYGVQKACEAVHVQMNLDDKNITLVNLTDKKISGAAVTANLYDFNLNKIWSLNETADLEKNSSLQTSWKVPVPDYLCFLKLEEKDKDGVLLSENFYWLNGKYDYRELKNLQAAKLKGSVIKEDNENGMRVYKVAIKNEGSSLALMTCVSIKDRMSGLEVLPAYWSSNYVTLLPGESISLQAEVNKVDLPESVVVECSPYNTTEPLILVP